MNGDEEPSHVLAFLPVQGHRLPRVLRGLWLALLFAGFLQGQGLDLSKVTQPLTASFGVEKGLPGPTALSLAWDRRGVLWAGTSLGAAWFDGLRWHAFNPPTTTGLVRSLHHAADGTLWLGTESNGIWRHEAGQWTQFNQGQGANDLLQTRTIAPGLYAATRGQGLLKWSGQAWDPVPTPFQFVWQLRELVGPDGRLRLWAATSQGLWATTGGGWERMGAELPALEASNALSEGVDPQGRPLLWVACWRKGLAQWDGRVWKLAEGPASAASLLPTCLTFDAASPGGPTLWMGTYNGGLFWYTQGKWHGQKGLSSQIQGIFALLLPKGPRPSIWAAIRQGGVGYLDLGGVRTLLPLSPIRSEQTPSLVVSSPEQAWVGTNQGLWRLDGGGERKVDTPKDMLDSFVHALWVEAEPAGSPRIWAGTTQGLRLLERGRWRQVGRDEGFPEGAVHSLVREGGRLWAGTEQGLGLLEHGQWRFHRPPAWPIQEQIQVMLPEPGLGSTPAMWVSTRESGMWRFQEGEWTHHPLGGTEGGSRISDIAMTQSADGRAWLWAAFLNLGLARMELGRPGAAWTLLKGRDLVSFSDLALLSLQGDGQGHLYMGTNRGLARFGLAETPKGPEPRLLKFFGQADGLPSESLAPKVLRVDPQGRVWMGTGAGLAVLDPAMEREDPRLPSPILNRLEFPSRSLSPVDGYQVGHRDTRFWVEFLLPSYYRREEAEFRTQLVGFDAQPGGWRKDASREFTGLPSGAYRLLVWARDYAGREVGPTAWSFRVVPPPWFTWWAWTIYGLILALLASSLVRWRTRRLSLQTERLEGLVEERTRDLALAKAAAEASARTKSEFLANMSHEIRTPMNAVIGFSHLGLQLDLAPKARDYFQKIATSGQSLLGVINDVLDFSKVEAGKLELEMAPFKLQGVLSNLGDLFQRRAEQKGVELVFFLDPGVPEVLVGDALRLGQVLTNLVSNALKFTEQGEVVVHVVPKPSEGNRIVLAFSVADSGIGMSAEQAGRLFQAFAQADTSTTRKFGGTGLGLVISQRLVALMGGDIRVISEVGKGSRFTFEATFPQPEWVSGAVPAMARQLLAARVLLAVEHPATREALSAQLRGFGMVATTVETGEAALWELGRAFASEPYSVIVLDPDLACREDQPLALRLESDPRFASLPRVLLRAAGREYEREVSLAKPVLPDPFRSALLAALGHAKPTGQASPMIFQLREYQGLRGVRVLLVEDNEINQQVASEILSGAGVSVEIASSGPEAIRKVNQETFDAVLMDIQMPDMDGFETTARIREKTRHAELPILAMTAHAMAGYREECLAGGMNDYITKPIEPQNLFEVLSLWIKGRETGVQHLSTPSPDPSPEPRGAEIPMAFDRPAGLRRLGGNQAMYARLAGAFATDFATFEQDLQQALESGDLGLAERHAHTLKGVAGNLSAVALAKEAAPLEAALRARDLEVARAALPALQVALNEARAAVPALVSSLAVQPAEAPQAATHRALSELFEELETRLSQNDPRAEDTTQELAKALPGPAFRAPLQQLGEALEAFDFNSAKTALTALQEAHFRTNEGGS